MIPASVPQVALRFRTFAARSLADPAHLADGWETAVALTASPALPGHYQIDLNQLGLKDGTYEYEFVIDGDAEHPISDPYAEELTKFGGYRGMFHIMNGQRVRRYFSWQNELPDGGRLPDNNEIVIYEMAVHWMSLVDEGQQVALGTLEKTVFERLTDLCALGINAIELLPIQDSADTLSWGYGSRYFYAPDWEMGTSLDLKFFIKCCHQRGIRVILDIVMNHARECPLERLAGDWYFVSPASEEAKGREGWGGRLFRYATPVQGHYLARDFQYHMAEFWIREYHVDGFRIDEFKSINNWDFVQEFRERAWREHDRLFPERPFIVIAEDSGRNAGLTQKEAHRGRRVVDAVWNFSFRDEIRTLLRDGMNTASRRDRIQHLISGRKMWDGWFQGFRDGFTDMAQAVNYVTSHDMESQDEQRLMNLFLADLLQQRCPNHAQFRVAKQETKAVRGIVDHSEALCGVLQCAHSDALARVGSAFALLLTAVGIPMFVAGEEFGDIHDLEHTNWRLKQVDAVNWNRRNLPGHQGLLARVSELIKLRTRHAALQRNEVEFFYFHPNLDEAHGIPVFAYCRTGGKPLGSTGQVIVLANCGPTEFAEFDFPTFWNDLSMLHEHGAPPGAGPPTLGNAGRSLRIPLGAFQVRVFSVCTAPQ